MTMKKEMTLDCKSARFDSIKDADQLIIDLMKSPVEWLRNYFSAVLGKHISMTQFWLIINAQAAFLALILPADYALSLRLAAAGWFLDAILRCRRSL